MGPTVLTLDGTVHGLYLSISTSTWDEIRRRLDSSGSSTLPSALARFNGDGAHVVRRKMVVGADKFSNEKSGTISTNTRWADDLVRAAVSQWMQSASN